MTHDDNTAKIIDAIGRLETRNEQRFVEIEKQTSSVREAIARLEVHVGNIKENRQGDTSRQTEDRGGARQWLAILFSCLIGVASIFLSMERHK
ncbi:hypothetical protein [Armatimonas sp.]|uniref:hypothetical protein n=1 Tax=Armatimonas sp. TaxID=1872638 RepID=UPI0037535B58